MKAGQVLLDHMGLLSLPRTDLSPDNAKCMINQEEFSVALYREEQDAVDGGIAPIAGHMKESNIRPRTVQPHL